MTKIDAQKLLDIEALAKQAETQIMRNAWDYPNEERLIKDERHAYAWKQALHSPFDNPYPIESWENRKLVQIGFVSRSSAKEYPYVLTTSPRIPTGLFDYEDYAEILHLREKVRAEHIRQLKNLMRKENRNG